LVGGKKIALTSAVALVASAVIGLGTNYADAQPQVKKRSPGDIWPDWDNPFERIRFGYPILVLNISLLAVGIMHHRKMIPRQISDLMIKVLSGDVSRRVSLLSLGALLVTYVSLTANELGQEESMLDYYNVKTGAERFSLF
jgi:hypothetical protein